MELATKHQIDGKQPDKDESDDIRSEMIKSITFSAFRVRFLYDYKSKQIIWESKLDIKQGTIT